MAKKGKKEGYRLTIDITSTTGESVATVSFNERDSEAVMQAALQHFVSRAVKEVLDLPIPDYREPIPMPDPIPADHPAVRAGLNAWWRLWYRDGTAGSVPASEAMAAALNAALPELDMMGRHGC